MRFSQRIGITPTAKIIQKERIDKDLRVSIWNALNICYLIPGETISLASSPVRWLLFQIWADFLKQPVDSMSSSYKSNVTYLWRQYENLEWYQIYDFIEFIVQNDSISAKNSFIAKCNEVLERENSAYRLVNGLIVEIASEEEIQEIEDALDNAEPYAGVKTHIQQALVLMSDRVNPDYRNSIKESISAVESLSLQVTEGKSNKFSDALAELEKSKALHPSLRRAFSALYGYTSDSDGIRHALLEEGNLTKADARFMLICCSAFVNYAIDTIGTT